MLNGIKVKYIYKHILYLQMRQNLIKECNQADQPKTNTKENTPTLNILKTILFKHKNENYTHLKKLTKSFF